jgi:rod shape determining protein RodA
MIRNKTSSFLGLGQAPINRMFNLIKHIDYSFLFVVLCLCFYGLLIIYSTTHLQATESGSLYYVKQQLIYILAGIALAFLISLIDYHEIEKLALPLYLAAVAALIYVIFFGRTTGGAQRWIVIAGYDFQPSEFAKIALICFLANYFYSQKEKLSYSIYFSLPFLFTIIPMLLIFRQPDLGSSMVFLAILLCMIFVAGIKWKHIIMMFLITLASFPILWSFLKDYQKNRLILFINPNLDPLGAGYNVIQSKVAIGSGGLLGQGLFSGIQSQLKFLPAQHTDFVFSVIGEEMGFFGAVLLLILFVIVLWKGIKIAQEAPDLLGTFLATGVVAFLFFHIFINIGMAMGLMPATGLPLSFISYGGTFMISNFIGIGILFSVHIRSVFT